MTAIVDVTCDLTAELCRQFTDITGWPLRHTAAQRGAQAQQDAFERDPGCRWFVPLSDGARTTGFLHLHEPEAPQRAEYVEAVGLAESLARMLERVTQATAQLSARNKDVSTLLNLGLAIPVQDDLAFALSQLLKAATHLTGSRSAAFFLLDASVSQLKLRALYQLVRDDVPQAERDLKISRPDLRALADAPVMLRTDVPGGHPLFPESMRRAMIVSVQSEHVPFGTLWVYDRRDKDYTRRDMHVLQSIAAQVAAVLERSALLQGDEQQARLSRDVQAASESHNVDNLRDLPVDDRFEIAARCTSCYELGGDLCEAIPVSADRIALAVGDASGNSIPAAMIMSAVRGALLTHPVDGSEVSQLLTKVNRGLCRIARSHQFMSLCYGIYDAENWTFTYCNAGHPMPMLIRDGHVSSLDSHGLLLGVLDDIVYPQSKLQMDRGDVLVLYSDGISEAHGDNQLLFRSEGIADAVRHAGRETAQNVLDSIWDRVDTHIGGGSQGDDRTLLVLKVR